MSEGVRAVPDQLPLTHSSAGADRQRLCLKPPATCHQSSQKNQEIQKKPKIGKTQGGEKKKNLALMWKGLRSGCLQLCIRHSKLCKAWNTVIVASFEEALVKNTMLRARVELTSFSWEVMCLQIWYPGNRFTQIIKKKNPHCFQVLHRGQMDYLWPQTFIWERRICPVKLVFQQPEFLPQS